MFHWLTEWMQIENRATFAPLEGLDSFLDVIDLFIKDNPAPPPYLRRVLSLKGEVLRRLGRPADAVAYYREAVRVSRETVSDAQKELGGAVLGLASLNLQMGAWQEAREGIAELVSTPSDDYYEGTLLDSYLDALDGLKVPCETDEVWIAASSLYAKGLGIAPLEANNLTPREFCEALRNQYRRLHDRGPPLS